ncbi:HupE/UreJ family protein [Chryseobacterium suipulveris]|uniref:HupE/UreJ family protein n=1 Tax=Chryseobacterium suipulveris TaxID=2929800 RepID=A0ABY4BPS4_9FLAO|nr:HupE/UreJ family protein [Chryseobacterium suipulveris]UOE40754.1 HupE/UreJ family protein [Chryseobacterium suipulveris]
MQDFFFYLKLGWEHIISLDALDHQLFILALVAVYALSDWKKILILVTAFTIGHSITLALSVLDFFRIPTDWVEFLIPLTIVIIALDNIFFKGNQSKLMRINYFLALIFGLIHGMGFANTARMMMAKEQNIFVPLLGFNLGLEMGQILVVVIVLLLEFFIFKYLKIKKVNWILIVSFFVLLVSLKICIDRFPLS